MFQDAESINRNVTADLQAVPSDAFVEYFSKNFLNYSTNVFKLRRLL
jgi:hypothetical protein